VETGSQRSLGCRMSFLGMVKTERVLEPAFRVRRFWMDLVSGLEGKSEVILERGGLTSPDMTIEPWEKSVSV
jgi:hypothetical protein